MEEDEPGLVRDAQAGDHAALRELLARYVPLVYNLVGRSVSRPADVEDVTQEALLRIVRDLPELGSPASFRSWLVTVTVHQIGDHFRRLGAEPLIPVGPAELEQVAENAEPGIGFEDLAVLWFDLQGQHRELVNAGRWLDQEHRTLLALWWEECAGRITRAEIATALEVGEAHTAVRLQRMREQLEQCRVAEAALDREPLCTVLDELVHDWDGEPNPLWRKRITRHVRTCVVCLRESGDQLPAARLFAGLQLLPLPAALVAALVARDLLPEHALFTDDVELVAEHPSSTGFNKDGGTWGTVRWAGRIATVTTAATLMLFAGGFLYDVTQTPRVRTETRNDATALSASMATQAPSATATPTPSPTPTPEAKKTTTRKAARATGAATSTGTCSTNGSTDRTWASWTMPNSGENLPDQHDYTVRANGTVLDDVTCLVWQQDVPQQRYTFEAAQNYCAGLDLAGGDWHLPTRVELTSLIDTTRSGTAIDQKAFPGTPVAFFWTSSPWATAHDPAFAWIVNFYEGITSNAADQSGEYAVRCVQSAAGKGSPDYEISDGQVEDPGTGLVWQRATGPAMSAQKATSYCAGLTLGGEKWRLPGVQELATLVDETIVGPAIDRDAFPDTPARDHYWSANQAAPEDGARWALSYDDGYTNYRDLSEAVVRCVRSA
ncbi:sigma-70 family RNA polymerase sigma factor [Kineosporia sp. J2-2]|uniref:Sigma-70 family RNA polymerase sigma factor n=1 Tax=Kineosporia corallincola TaxID=2835133 RepID=A0ABS5THR2_9ACTN|nr:sigma-70 family RNA polymerase sigma factor [Kineosporia corallincola]MBT0770631.1 sigma-70 family RNA polymerase sigma factor [Kineosporia corallincola]